MSIIIVVASCASGVALVLILIGVAGAVRCRRVNGHPRRRTSGGGAGAASKRPSVNAAMNFSELGPYHEAQMDGDIGLAVAVSPTSEIADCSECNRRGHVIMNGIKATARSRRSSEESSVRYKLALFVSTDHVRGHLGDGLCKPDDPINSVKAQKEATLSSKSGFNPVTTTPCYF